MKPLLIGLFIINLCSGELSANGPLIANIPGIAQTTAAPQAFEKVLNETTPTLYPNASYKLNITVKIGTSYRFTITRVALPPPETPSTGPTEEPSANSTGLPPTSSSSHAPTSSSSHAATSSSSHVPKNPSSHAPSSSSSRASTSSSSHAPSSSSPRASTSSSSRASTSSSSRSSTSSSSRSSTSSSSRASTISSSRSSTSSSSRSSTSSSSRSSTSSSSRSSTSSSSRSSTSSSSRSSTSSSSRSSKSSSSRSSKSSSIRTSGGGPNGGNRLELNIHVQPGSSYGFDTTNTENSEPAVQIHVNVTMCNGNEEDAETVERSKNNSYEISAGKIESMLKNFRCSETNRVMNLIISVDIPMKITIVGYATPPSSPPTSPPPKSTRATTHASTRASITPPASSITTGWIIGIVFIVLFALTLIAAIAVFVYFYLKKRRGSINEDRDGLFKRQQFVDGSPSRNLPFPKTVNNYQTPQTSSTIPAVNNYSSSQPYNYPQLSSNYPKLMRPNIQPLQPNVASPINPITPNNNLYGPRGLSRNY